MRAFLLLTTLVSLLGCGQEGTSTPGTKEFSYFVESFQQEASLSGSYIPSYIQLSVEYLELESLSFVEDDRIIAGVCVTESAYRRKVYISEPFWNKAPDWQRELLIYHELGHCLLGLAHDDRLDEEGNAVSIMHPVIDFVAAYETNREYYLNQLFIENEEIARLF